MASSARHAHSEPTPAIAETAEVTDLVRHGLRRFQEGNFEQAARIFTALVGGAPHLALSWNHHAMALISLGRQVEAERALRRSVAIDPTQPQAWNSLAGTLAQLGRFEEAEAACRAARAVGGETGSSWQIIAMARTAQDDFPAAAEAFARAIELDGPSASLCANLGAALLKCGRFAEADAALASAAAFDDATPAITEAKQLSGLMTAALAGEPDAGPQTPDAHFKTALLLLDAGDERAAAARIGEVWAHLRPENIEAQHLRDAMSARAVERQPAALVAQQFDALAESFEEHLVSRLGYDGPAQLRILLAACGEAEASLDVLDLGCGTGLCAEALAPHARRLTGVDLSGAMLAKARARGLYQSLEQRDLLDALATPGARWDMIVAFDTFPYLGALDETFAAAAQVLRPGGWFVFSTEHAQGDSYRLRGNGRFAHGAEYVTALAAGRFEIVRRHTAPLRREAGRTVDGGYYLLRAHAKV
ncbi:methyltransferase domain-containing protein [Phenylobacterium sp.]|jgi:predicted TPR repeat methyltransferase|uniref:methyltransferase domain-containing protein n=1 Tax=Phenylobacterium sp. TaxID=1871053 RepID=UPI001214A7C1|nr:methyltransferase domain-containing protein [Phenylobacterium sp.]THD72129.1 MAG: methyltransferase domain-containing protein [Phenylobacterium sp.]